MCTGSRSGWAASISALIIALFSGGCSTESESSISATITELLRDGLDKQTLCLEVGGAFSEDWTYDQEMAKGYATPDRSQFADWIAAGLGTFEVIETGQSGLLASSIGRFKLNRHPDVRATPSKLPGSESFYLEFCGGRWELVGDIQLGEEKPVLGADPRIKQRRVDYSIQFVDVPEWIGKLEPHRKGLGTRAIDRFLKAAAEPQARKIDVFKVDGAWELDKMARVAPGEKFFGV